MNTTAFVDLCDTQIILFVVKLLEITKEERDKARKKYESDREMVKEGVAFGRRADGPPKKVYTPPPSGTFDSFGFDQGKG